MLIEYIETALRRAKFETIKDKKEPFYGEIVVCKGVWATGKTLEECKQKLRNVLESWLFVRIKKGLNIPVLDGKSIEPLVRISYDKIEVPQVA